MSTPDELSQLERAVHDDPRNAKLRYLLGAELAQHQHYTRAVEEITQALVHGPELHTARLQLGLLYLTLGQSAPAVASWAPLERLREGSPLLLFKRGLEALVRDDFAQCIRFLEAGIAGNSENPALNRDMGLIVDKAREALSVASGAPAGQIGSQPAGGPGDPAAPAGEATPAVRTDFSLYDQ